MPFKVGDSVKVKEGIICPDDDSVCIGGWRGRVSDIEDDIVGIRWDSITLKQLPHEYIKKSEDEGLGWAEMYLSVAEIEQVLPRDSEAQAVAMAQEMENKVQWISMGKEGERIAKVIANADDADDGVEHRQECHIDHLLRLFLVLDTIRQRLSTKNDAQSLGLLL